MISRFVHISCTINKFHFARYSDNTFITIVINILTSFSIVTENVLYFSVFSQDIQTAPQTCLLILLQQNDKHNLNRYEKLQGFH